MINIFRSYIPSLKIKIKKKKYIQNIPLDRSVSVKMNQHKKDLQYF